MSSCVILMFLGVVIFQHKFRLSGEQSISHDLRWAETRTQEKTSPILCMSASLLSSFLILTLKCKWMFIIHIHLSLIPDGDKRQCQVQLVWLHRGWKHHDWVTEQCDSGFQMEPCGEHPWDSTSVFYSHPGKQLSSVLGLHSYVYMCESSRLTFQRICKCQLDTRVKILSQERLYFAHNCDFSLFRLCVYLQSIKVPSGDMRSPMFEMYRELKFLKVCLTLIWGELL